MAKTNRNNWNAEELQVLANAVQDAKNPSEGCKRAAKLLGRTYNACTFKYYTRLKLKKSEVLKTATTEMVGSSILTFKIKSAKVENGYLTLEI